MEYCKYHPLLPATFHCKYCNRGLCDSCVNDGTQGQTTCFCGGHPVESVGARYSAEPFWRRLKESLRYPLNTEAIVLIVVSALLSAIIPYMLFWPLILLSYLLLIGAFMKYCFSCLESTANGTLTAPDITVAYGGGIGLVLHLVAIIFIMVVTVVAAFFWLGSAIGTLLGVLYVCSFPAVLITFAMTEDLFAAVNPVKIIYLISAIGLPYGLLLMLIMVMLGSVSVLEELIGNDMSFVTMSLQSVVSNYYTIVIFHIMGYVIFQYQGQLGFIAHDDSAQSVKVRSDLDRLLAYIDISIKEGNYEQALSLFQEGVKLFPEDKNIFFKCFEFLLATRQAEPLREFAILFLRYLSDNQRSEQVVPSYKRVLQFLPNYKPFRPEDRYWLAKACYASGDSRSVAKLLHNLHKEYPDYTGLANAYKLLAEAMRDLPNLAKQADLIVKLATQLQKVQAKKKEQRVKLAKEKRSKPKSNIKGLDNDVKDFKPQDIVDSSDQHIDYDGGIDFN